MEPTSILVFPAKTERQVMVVDPAWIGRGKSVQEKAGPESVVPEHRADRASSDREVRPARLLAAAEAYSQVDTRRAIHRNARRLRTEPVAAGICVA